MFRARLLAAVKAEGLPLPAGLPERWVVDCKHVGKGKPALEYLSRYLYRGVIGESSILAEHNGQVAFSKLAGSSASPAGSRQPRSASFSLTLT